MARKEFVAALTAVTILTGCGSAENRPPPAPTSSSPAKTSNPSPKELLAIPPPPAGYIGSWPPVDQCPQQGVYMLPQATSPEIACAVGETVKSRIDSAQEVNFINYDGEVILVEGLGRCALNLLTAEATSDGSSSQYVGWARMDPNNQAEVVFFPYTNFISSETETALLQPTDQGVFATVKDNAPKPIGVLVGQSFCRS